MTHNGNAAPVRPLRFIVFDLDETLYPRQAGIMQQIDRLMTKYMMERLGMTSDEARRLRRHYWEKYGTTLAGLRANGKVDAHEFLDYVHDVPMGDYLAPDARLDAALARIPLQKVVFTNGSLSHARRVLDALGVAHHFSHIYDVAGTDFLSKPNRAAYERLLELLGAQGDECIMVDDTARNLAPAKALGMVTVLVDNLPDASVDFLVKEVAEVAGVVAQILTSRQNAG